MPFIGRLAAGLALVGLVAAASTSHFNGGGELSSGSAGYAVLVVGAAAALVVAVFWLTLGGFAARVEMRRSTRLMLLGTVSAMLLAAGALLFAPFGGEADRIRPFDCTRPLSYYEARGIDFEKMCPGGGSAAGMSRGSGGGGAGNGTVAIVLAAGTSLLILIVLGTAVVMAMRRRRSNTVSAVEDAPVLQALDESLDDLRREGDVRRAIVACYARMEAALERSGRGRREHEAPLEFLTRMLEQVAREPGRVLTELFERARFSVEPMGEQDKRKAIAALEALRVAVGGSASTLTFERA